MDEEKNRQDGVLVTGGTGLIGSELVPMLQERGYRVHVLSRSKSGRPGTFHWDVEEGTIDRKALEGIDHIVHLAGAGLADKRWTKKRKREIIDSRVLSAKLLYDAVQQRGTNLRSFVSPSGIDYYADHGNEVLAEHMKPGEDFLSQVCIQWEESSRQFSTLNVRNVQLRLGLVLSPDGGMLKEVYRPLQYGMAPYFGDGKQVYSWVHIHDVCRAFVHALERDHLSGPYNVVGDHPVTNKNFIKTLKTVTGKRAVAFGVPAFALRLLLGEMADAVLGSAHVSAKKIKDQGFRPQFEYLQPALQDLLTPAGFHDLS
jgi:uncharacterized protein (TIGR01777 family)